MRRPPISSLLWRSQRVYQIFAANTDVGKTIFTTLLCKAARRKQSKDRAVAYLKPVSTGPASESDERSTATLFQYTIPVSPHLAAKVDNNNKETPSDSSLLARCYEHANDLVTQHNNNWLFIETAGGVHSPAPSGTTQAELYAPLRAPIVLVGDSKLGGISQTISAFESLRIRGYDIASVLLFNDAPRAPQPLQNAVFLADYFGKHHASVRVDSVESPPARQADRQADTAALAQYYREQTAAMQDVVQHLDERHQQRIASLESMADQAHRIIWYPFTQHSLLKPEKITVIDSAHGDYFQTLAPAKHELAPLLQPSFDASASWWTQGLGHASSRLTLAAAHAAGRYGHVMFAEAVHQPALSLAQTLLHDLGNPRLRRVFVSDNGSTGMEVAVKMALRAARLRYYGHDNEQKKKLEILGLKGAYHGDTMAAMDCAEPCVFNETTEWYEGKGFWFDVPSVLCVEGEWRIHMPHGLEAKFAKLDDVFDLAARIARGDDVVYKRLIRTTLQQLQQQGRRFGALIIEPVVLGAGGMVLVDPLFQRALVEVVRESGSPSESASSPHDWQGLPVVFDEVFTGLYRLGRVSSASFLGVHPDISVHAKLLTGGLVPLCTTLASESIFDTFSGGEKTSALLHGHSYTAHPVGCQVALESLAEMRDLKQSGAWDWAQRNWANRLDLENERQQQQQLVWSVWPRAFVEELSWKTQKVEGVWALGSVLAIHLKDSHGAAGYQSNAAIALRDRLAQGRPQQEWNVHARVLGHVLYVMTGQTTKEEDVSRLSSFLLHSLEDI